MSAPPESPAIKKKRQLPAAPSPSVGAVASRTPSMPRRASEADGSAPLSARPVSEQLSEVFEETARAEEGGDSQHVTVAVRVRPFNDREVRLGSTLVIDMLDNKTFIRNEEKGKSYDFAFDHSFWSHAPTDSHFANQDHVYAAIGQPLIESTLKGYNCCIFAYGQTGSGKSYSMMGYGSDPGLIPRFCRDLFERMQAADGKAVYKTEVSYFEIYSENIFDLLAIKSAGPKRKLRVREHPVNGPYVEELSSFAAVSFNDVQGYLEAGSRQRATAATNMNATSSRSHSVFIITLTQTTVVDGEEHNKVSRVNLVDLAGSERSDAAGTSGVRLREGSAINKSLHTLGKVISILAGRNDAKKRVFIPYRDSVLTWILKESLGGNSRTAMLATISPASENYEETLSTLRYAFQARSIVNAARVNEDTNVALIRSLRQEIDMLRAQLGDGQSVPMRAEIETLKSKLVMSERMVQEINKSWEEKLKIAERLREENQRRMEKQGVTEDMRKVENRLPNLVNLNEDPQLSETLIFIIREGMTVVGSEPGCEVRLQGVFVRPRHCEIMFTPDSLILRTLGDSTVYVNGVELASGAEQPLVHGDRLIFGRKHYFRLNIPQDKTELGDGPDFSAQPVTRDYAFAHEEFMRVQQEKMQAELAQEKALLAVRAQAELESARRLIEAEQEAKRRELEIAEDLRRKKLEEAFALRMEEMERNLRRKGEEEAAAARLEERKMATEMHMAELQAQRILSMREKEEAIRTMEEAKSVRLEQLERERCRLEQEIQTFQLAAKEDDAPGEPESVEMDLEVGQMIKEANELAANCKQPVSFRRGPHFGNDIQVLVTNTQLRITTTWPWDTFCDRLEELRTLYLNQTDQSRGEIEKLLYNPNDDWVNDAVEPFADASDELIALERSIQAEALNRSDLDASASKLSSVFSRRPPTVPYLARRYIESCVEGLGAAPPRSKTDVMISYLSAIKASADRLASSVDVPNAQGLSEQADVRNACFSAAVSMNLFISSIRAIKAEGGDADLLARLSDAAEPVADNTLKVLQGVDIGSEAMVRGGHTGLLAAINVASMVIGELAIATQPPAEPGTAEDDDEEGESEDEPPPDALGSSGRMVDLGRAARASELFEVMPVAAGVDSSILEAFGRGALKHVAASLETYRRGLTERVAIVEQIAGTLTDKSNVNKEILAAITAVVESTGQVVDRAQEFQAAIIERQDDSLIQRVFYRKSYSRAKGIINQVQGVVNAINGLTDACSFAAAGSEDVADVMSRVDFLRKEVTHLQVAAVSKARTGPLQRIAQTIKDAAALVLRDTATVNKECNTLRSSDAFVRRAQRERSSSTTSGPVTPRRTAVLDGVPQSPVMRNARMIEYTANVRRLENELMLAQRALQQLNQEQYRSEA